MKFKSALKYRLYDSKKPVIIFYLVIVALILLTYISVVSFNTLTGETNGHEITAAIFLFIMGLNSFKESFRFFMQNGVSRRAILLSQLISSLILCLTMSLIDNVILVICENLLTVEGKLEFAGIFKLLFTRQYNAVPAFLLSFLFCFSIYSMASSSGFFITTLYYRLNKGQKTAVSIGVPVALIFAIPALDVYIFKQAISHTVSKIIVFAFKTPFNAIMSGIILSVIFYGFTWLLTRRAVIKD